MIRTTRWKLIHYPKIERWQLFDIANDPLERHNLSNDADYETVRKQLRVKLEQARRAQHDIE